jgi:uncharacterized protein YecT (DUF1311 family)
MLREAVETRQSGEGFPQAPVSRRTQMRADIPIDGTAQVDRTGYSGRSCWPPQGVHKVRSIGIVIFASLVGWLALPAFAQDPNEPTGLAEQEEYLGIRPAYQSCIDHGDGSMPSMIACAEGEFAYQDKRLNAVYGRVMKSMSTEQKSALRTEERAWIAKKNVECAMPDAPGQGQILDAIGCSITATARRARQLEHLGTE